MTNTLNDAGISLIKSFESCSLTPYQDVKGVWTIGFGHTGDDVTADMSPCTQEQADAWLVEDLQTAKNDITECTNVDLTDNQYSALVSLIYNCGGAPLTGHLGQYINQKNMQSAADEFLVWDHAQIDGVETVVQGLLRRREAERQLFLQSST